MFLSRVGTSDSSLEEVRQDQQKHISSITIATVALDSVYLKFLHFCSSKKMDEIFTIAGAIAGAKSVAHDAAMTQNLGMRIVNLHVIWRSFFSMDGWLVVLCTWWFLCYQNEKRLLLGWHAFYLAKTHQPEKLKQNHWLTSMNWLKCIVYTIPSLKLPLVAKKWWDFALLLVLGRVSRQRPKTPVWHSIES